MSYTIPEEWFGLSILEFADKVGCADDLLDAIPEHDDSGRWTKLLDGLSVGKVEKTTSTRTMGSASGTLLRPKMKMTGHPLDDFESMSDTFRHEMAHLLDFCARGRSNHDRYWRVWAQRMGATPRATSPDRAFRAATEKKRKVIARCTECGVEWNRVRRTDMSGRIHTGVHPETLGKCKGLVLNVFDSLEEARRFPHYNYGSGWVGNDFFEDLG